MAEDLFDVPPSRTDEVHPRSASPWANNVTGSSSDEKFVSVSGTHHAKTKERKRYSEKLAKQLQSIGVNVDLVSGLERSQDSASSKNVPVTDERLPQDDGSKVDIKPQDDGSKVDIKSAQSNMMKKKMLKIADETLNALEACSTEIESAAEDNNDVLSGWDPMKESYEQKGFNSYQEPRYNTNHMEKHKPQIGPDGKSKISPTKSSAEDLRLFIANIPISLTEEGLRNMFSSVGKCRDVKKLRVREGENTGVGFVTFTSVREAENAILKYNDYQFGNDIKLRVKLAREKVPESHEELQWGTPNQQNVQTDDSLDLANENARKEKLKSILKGDPETEGLGTMDRDVRYPAQKEQSPTITKSPTTRLFQKPPVRTPLTKKEKRAEADYFYDKLYADIPDYGDDYDAKDEVTAETNKAVEVRTHCNAESSRVEEREERAEERIERNVLHSAVHTPKLSPLSRLLLARQRLLLNDT